MDIVLDSFQMLCPDHEAQLICYQLSLMVPECPRSELGMLRSFYNYAVSLFRVKPETGLTTRADHRVYGS